MVYEYGKASIGVAVLKLTSTGHYGIWVYLTKKAGEMF